MNIKERPILFNGEMIRAILAGNKTQTRRVRRALCPYEAGTRLWVREAWAVGHAFDGASPAYIPDVANSLNKPINIHYAATEDLGGLIKRPSIHMPRWASRILLEVRGVRVERLQDISEEDAMKEGICCENSDLSISNRLAFSMLWDSIYDNRSDCSWNDNPWVCVVEFEVIEPRQTAE